MSIDPGFRYSSFTRRGLIVDHVNPAETLGETKQGKSRGCNKTREEAVEDGKTIYNSEVIGT